MKIEERISKRGNIRVEIAAQTTNPNESILLLISESMDDYIEYRIEADKMLYGILTDIQGSIEISKET